MPRLPLNSAKNRGCYSCCDRQDPARANSGAPSSYGTKLAIHTGTARPTQHPIPSEEPVMNLKDLIIELLSSTGGRGPSCTRLIYALNGVGAALCATVASLAGMFVFSAPAPT